MLVKIKNTSLHSLPEYQTVGSAGLDLKANLESPVSLGPLERVLIPTGLFIELPQGIEAQIRPRSGMAIKKGITVLNSPGTIDSDYRGEIGIMLVNLSGDEVTIEDGERVAQMVISSYEKAEWEIAESLVETDRGAGGYGSTGTK